MRSARVPVLLVAATFLSQPLRAAEPAAGETPTPAPTSAATPAPAASPAAATPNTGAADAPGAASRERLRQAGVDVPKPERTKLVRPVYPPEALGRGEQALVVVELILDESGKVAEARALHGPEPFASAALKAAREWEFQPSLVDGKPVRLRYTLPITFSLPLPPMKRDRGVPELRQGVGPRLPASARGKTASAVAQVEVDEEGRVASATVKTGESPFREALLEAIRTWRFASPESHKRVAFDVRADFGEDGKVALDLTGPRAPTASSAEPAPAPETGASPGGATGGTPGSPDAPGPDSPDAVEAAPPSVVTGPSEPPVEVVSGGMVPAPPSGDPAATPPPAENGLSSIRDVELAPGIPDLVRGRRPVSPPLARMGEIEGDVEVRFSIDSGGATAVTNANGPEELKEAALALVKSWGFRRTAAHRVFALAQVEYRMSGSKARVRPVP